MPQNLPEQILQRIIRLSADGNSQREVARMLEVHKQNFATQPRDWPTTSEEAWRFDENLHEREDRQLLHMVRTKHFISAPRLRMQLIRRFGRRMFEPFGDGFWPPDIGLGVQPDVLGSLWSTGDAAVSGGGGTEYGTSEMETPYLQWWVPVLPIPQWRSGPGAP